jgi:hypothetical protein
MEGSEGNGFIDFAIWHYQQKAYKKVFYEKVA